MAQGGAWAVHSANPDHADRQQRVRRDVGKNRLLQEREKTVYDEALCRQPYLREFGSKLSQLLLSVATSTRDEFPSSLGLCPQPGLR